MSNQITGAIVGLGQIGFEFNFDGRRSGVWTHERAFEQSGCVQLVAVADTELAQRKRFLKLRPSVPTFSSLGELLCYKVPDLVSICTPTITHVPLVRLCVRGGIGAIFCEKPLAQTAAEAASLVRLCREKGVLLAVNHTRRWEASFQKCAAVVRQGDIGLVRSVSARYSGHTLNMGTHLIDAIRHVTGLNPLRAVGFSLKPEETDPHVSGILCLEKDVFCSIACHGLREDLIFEIDIMGSEGRLRIYDNGHVIELQRFKPSRRCEGYRELYPLQVAVSQGRDRFIEAVRDISKAMANKQRKVACSGEDGYYALAGALALRDSARQRSRLKSVLQLKGATRV